MERNGRGEEKEGGYHVCVHEGNGAESEEDGCELHDV